MDYSFHWRPVLRSLPELLNGALVTIEISVLSMVLGVILGLMLAMMRMSESRPLFWFATVWVQTARNTPALFQLFFFGFGLGSIGINLPPFLIVLIGITFNNAGYLSENFRGGFKAVPTTQLRAARSLGMTAVKTYRYIIIPQVLRIVYHPITNQMVWAVMMSSLGMLVGFKELSGVTQVLASSTFRIFEYFAVAAVIYYIIAKLILGASRLIAWRFLRC